MLRENKLKDWKGNSKSTFTTLGASNHTDHPRALHDYYATDPQAIDFLLEVETFDGAVWENCCGEGHLSKRMLKCGLEVVSTDLIDRGYGTGGVDFFECTKALAGNIITNPPYAYAQAWVEHSLELLPECGKLALFLPLTFLETAERKKMFMKTPPVRVHVFSGRILCGMNGNFYELDKDGNVVYKKDGTPKRMSSAKAYAWFVWEKSNYSNKPTIDWLN